MGSRRPMAAFGGLGRPAGDSSITSPATKHLTASSHRPGPTGMDLQVHHPPSQLIVPSRDPTPEDPFYESPASEDVFLKFMGEVDSLRRELREFLTATMGEALFFPDEWGRAVQDQIDRYRDMLLSQGLVDPELAQGLKAYRALWKRVEDYGVMIGISGGFTPGVGKPQNPKAEKHQYGAQPKNVDLSSSEKTGKTYNRYPGSE